MFVSGKCEGMFELLEVIKTTAVKAGWSVLGEKTLNFNDIPRDAKYCYKEGNIGAISSSISNSSSFFKVILPRPFKVVSLSYKGDSTVSIWGIKYDQTRELIAENINSGAKFDESLSEYIQVEVRTNKAISDFHLELKANFEFIYKELYLSNNDAQNNVVLNLCSFLEPTDKNNLMIGTSTGYSPELGIESQLHSKHGFIMGDDGEMDYYISINAHRLALALKIYRPGDAIQKNEVWQFGYAGRLRLYGGEWSLPDCNAIISSSFNSARWSDELSANFSKPWVYFSGKFSEVSSTSLNSATTNKQNCNIVAPPGGEIFSTPIICYNSNNIFGELDGVYNIVAPDGVNKTDEITIGGKEFMVMQDGISFNRYDAFVFAKS